MLFFFQASLVEASLPLIHENQGLRTCRVAGVEPLHSEAACLDQAGRWTVKVTVPGAVFPDGREPALPAPDTGLRRQTMLDEAEDAVRLENAPDLGERLLRLRHAAERPGGDDAVDAAILQRQCFGHALDDLGRGHQAMGGLRGPREEFGRRIKDNGSGTDHGSGGVAFLIGNSVRGGMYGEYPSLEEKDQIEGDLRYNNDFRMTYSSILEQWLEIEAAPIVNGRFEQFDLIKS